MEFIRKYKLKIGYRPSGVYKITFDNKWFYIGSSKDIKTRVGKWVCNLKRGERTPKLVRDVFKICYNVTFEILEISQPSTNHKIAEDFYIKQNWGNPFLLNSSNSAFTAGGREKGFKHSEETKKIMQEKKALSIRKLSKLSQPVIQYDISGNQVSIFPAISYAARAIGTTPNTFQKTISKSKTGYHKGYIWKYAEKVVA